MNSFFIKNIKINKVRHLKDITIPLADDEKKHLILTGKNGSGKTSLLEAMATFLNSVTSSDVLSDTSGVMLEANLDYDDIHKAFKNGRIITAYYKADRIFKAQEPKHVEKVVLKDDYTIRETPGENLIKYLLDLKMTQALAASNGKTDKAAMIKNWFDSFEDLLKRIFESDSLKLVFDEDTFAFLIQMDGREPFSFNELSGGYAAVLDIIADLILRMERQTGRRFDFTIPGVVLIDEIETHLHLQMQKKVLELLTTVFPNVQFIVSTHSPFILNSLKGAVIYDLEKRLYIKDGLTDIPYEGIVEGYFDSDSLSDELREKFEIYKGIVEKKNLTDDDFTLIADLELYLDEIPDYLALDLTTEYQRLKQKLRCREDI